jgi:hypothetical protein
MLATIGSQAKFRRRPSSLRPNLPSLVRLPTLSTRFSSGRAGRTTPTRPRRTSRRSFTSSLGSSRRFLQVPDTSESRLRTARVVESNGNFCPRRGLFDQATGGDELAANNSIIATIFPPRHLLFAEPEWQAFRTGIRRTAPRFLGDRHTPGSRGMSKRFRSSAVSVLGGVVQVGFLRRGDPEQLLPSPARR